MIVLNAYRSFNFDFNKVDEASVISFNIKKDRDGSAISTFVINEFSDIKKGDIIHVVQNLKFSLYIGIIENIAKNEDNNTFTLSCTYIFSVLKLPINIDDWMSSAVSFEYRDCFNSIREQTSVDNLNYIDFGFYNHNGLTTSRFSISKPNSNQNYTFLDCLKNMVHPDEYLNHFKVFFSLNKKIYFMNDDLGFQERTVIFNYDNGAYFSKKKNNTISSNINKLLLVPSSSNILFKESLTYYLLNDGTITTNYASSRRITPVKAAMLFYSDDDAYNSSLESLAQSYFSQHKITTSYEFTFKAPVSEIKTISWIPDSVEDKTVVVEYFNPFQPVYVVEDGKLSQMLNIEEISYSSVDENGDAIYTFKIGKSQSPISKSILEINQKLESNRTNSLSNTAVKTGTTSSSVTGAQAIGSDTYSGIADQVSFDSISRNSTLSLKDTDHIFFRNENLKANETSKADYSAGKTLTQILSEGGQGGGISSVQISGTGNAVTSASYNTTSKILYLYKNSTFALSTDISQVVLTATLGLGVLNNNTTWGTTTSANGYTVRWGSDQAGGGGFVLSEKDGKTYLQIDGDYYGNEGQSRVAYYSELSSYALKSDLSSYVKSKESDNSNIYSEIINHATRGITLEYHLNSNPNARLKIVDGEITAGVYYEQGEDDDYYSEIKLDNYQISYKSTDGDYESVLTKEGLFSPHSGIFFKNNASIPHGAGIHKINGNLALQSSSNRIWIYNLNNRAGTFDFSRWIGGQDPTYYFPSKGGTFALTSDTEKNLYHLGAYDSVSGNVITRQTGYRNVSKWFLEVADSLTFRATVNGYQIGSDAGNGLLINPYLVNTVATGIVNKDFIFGDVNTSYGNSSNYILNQYWISLPNSFNTKQSYLNYFSQNEIIIQYKLATSYTEQIIENQPLNTLDQTGSQWVRDEWEKGLNLVNTKKVDTWTKHGITIAFNNNKMTITGSNDARENLGSISGYIDYEKIYDLLTEKNSLIFSSQNVSGTASDRLRLVVHNSNWTWQTTLLLNINSAIELKKENFSSSNDMFFDIYAPNVGNTFNLTLNLMLNEGNHAYPYQEYKGSIVRQIELKNYLPLSGGTLSSGNVSPLTINSTNQFDASVVYFSRNSTNICYVGYVKGMTTLSSQSYPYPKIGIVTSLSGNAGTVPIGKPFYSPDDGQTMYQLATTDQISAGQLLIKEFYAYSSSMTDFQNWMRSNSNTVISVIYYNYAFGDNWGNSVIFNIDDNVYKFVNSNGTLGNVALYSDDESGDDLIRVYYRG